jgi:hypothetical protein
MEPLEPIVVGVVIAAILLLRSLSGIMLVGALNDDGVYAVLGKAIAEGRGYISLHLANHPVQEKFPPGFPLILALLWKLSGSVEGVQHLVALIHPVVIGLTAGLLYWIGRTRLGASRALMCLFVLTPFVFEASIQYYTIPLSEPWLMLAWAGVLALWERSEGTAPVNRLLLVSAAGLTAAFAILVRSQGVVLIPAVIVAVFAHRFTLRDRVFAIVFMLVPLVIWHFFLSAFVARGPLSGLPDEAGYGSWAVGGGGALNFIAGSVASNIATYIKWIGYYLAGISTVGVVAAVLLIVLMIVGAFSVLRKQPLLAVSSLGGMVIVLLWPFAQDRLLLSVMPFAGLAAALWLTPSLSRLPEAGRRGLAYGTAVVLALVLMRQADIRGDALAGLHPPGDNGTFSPTWTLLTNSRFIANASAVVRTGTKPSDRVMIDNHSGIYLYTGRVTTPVSPAESHVQKSVFSASGHYLASRILRDSLSYIVVAALTHSSADASEPGIVRDVALVRTRCPGVLTVPGADQAVLMVHRDETCLNAIVAEKGIR